MAAESITERVGEPLLFTIVERASTTPLMDENNYRRVPGRDELGR